MHKSHWLLSVLFTFILGMASALAADTGNIEQIKPATSDAQHKECPMHQGKKECDHKKDGKPCPYHADEKHHGRKHEKCDHKQAS